MGLGFCDELVTYDQIACLSVDQRAVYVDMAGNMKVSRDRWTAAGTRLASGECP